MGNEEERLWSALLEEIGFDEEEASAIVANHTLSWLAGVVADAYALRYRRQRKAWIAEAVRGRGERSLWGIKEIRRKVLG